MIELAILMIGIFYIFDRFLESKEQLLELEIEKLELEIELEKIKHGNN